MKRREIPQMVLNLYKRMSKRIYWTQPSNRVKRFQKGLLSTTFTLAVVTAISGCTIYNAMTKEQDDNWEQENCVVIRNSNLEIRKEIQGKREETQALSKIFNRAKRLRLVAEAEGTEEEVELTRLKVTAQQKLSSMFKTPGIPLVGLVACQREPGKSFTVQLDSPRAAELTEMFKELAGTQRLMGTFLNGSVKFVASVSDEFKDTKQSISVFSIDESLLHREIY